MRVLVALLALAAPVAAQVHYHPDGRPWSQRANAGPDAEVPGWWYNLGVTGLRVELVEDRPTHLVVRHVFDGSPAARKVQVGDEIVGVSGDRFTTPHRNGYGMDVFGPEGPLADFAAALERAQGREAGGRLELTVLRGEKERDVTLRVGRDGVYSATWPADCEKTDRRLADALDHLVAHQREDGSWGSPPQDTFAPLALLASGEKKYRKALERNVRWHARTTVAADEGSLINWRYMAAAIVLSEYHLATGAKWVVEELEEIHAFLHSTQYVDLSQVSPRVKESHPDSWPTDPLEQHGGWGHNPGFEGYGPIAMLTGQGALAFALMRHCGVEVDRERHDAAYAFLERATGDNGYVWYEDQVAGHHDWADMGRTGAAGIANWVAPYEEEVYRDRARSHAEVIGRHPESFPDTHGSPVMGMGYAAMAASVHEASFRALMDANRWWFVLARCEDGSFYYQPNRDNAGYGADSRISATAAAAFCLAAAKRNLHVTGKPFGAKDAR